MIQFILYFFAIIGVCVIFYLIAGYFIDKAVNRAMEKEYEINFNLKADLAINSSDILTKLEGNRKDNMVLNKKFPSKSN